MTSRLSLEFLVTGPGGEVGVGDGLRRTGEVCRTYDTGTSPVGTTELRLYLVGQVFLVNEKSSRCRCGVGTDHGYWNWDINNFEDYGL